MELKNSTGCYTWTNNQKPPVMAAIDKISVILVLNKVSFGICNCTT
jgi:hypothetical protein